MPLGWIYFFLISNIFIMYLEVLSLILRHESEVEEEENA